MPEPNEGYFAGLSTFYAEMEGFQRQGKDPVLMEWSRFKTTEDEDGTDIYDGTSLKSSTQKASAIAQRYTE
jgi:hypothetical protein